jgi:hypothetical protein
VDVPTPVQLVPPPEPVPIGRTARQLIEDTPAEPEWLIPGLLAPGMTVELNGREKAGKGYLISYLIGALERGTRTVFGDTRATKVLIFTEESAQSMREKLALFNVEDAYVVFHWEQANMGGQGAWEDALKWLDAFMAENNEYSVLFVDNISSATRTQDEAGVELARKVEPLALMAREHGYAVLYDRHQRKAGGRVEDLSRGTTALAGAVDAIVAMEKLEGRVRRLTSRGRGFYNDWTKHVELSQDHTTYNEVIGDYRVQKLFERKDWSAPEFAEAISRGVDTARDWLNECEFVRKDGAGRNTRYIVVAERAELD